MTHDLDQLRAVLRDRAALAFSDPADLLPRTRQLAHRRQVRRRAGLVVGAVVGTALVMIGATMSGGLFPRDWTAVQPQPLSPPKLPFTVGALPGGLRLAEWRVNGNFVTFKPLTSPGATYAGPHETVHIDLLEGNPAAIVAGAHPTFTMHGVTASIEENDPVQRVWQVSWPADRGHWISVAVFAGPGSLFSVSELIAIAKAITWKPSSPPTALRIRYVPPGFRLFSWQHYGPPTDPSRVVMPEDAVQLCKLVSVGRSHTEDCIAVTTGGGNLASARTINGLPVTVGRQDDSGHWIGVSGDADPAVLNTVLRAVSLG